MRRTIALTKLETGPTTATNARTHGATLSAKPAVTVIKVRMQTPAIIDMYERAAWGVGATVAETEAAIKEARTK